MSAPAPLKGHDQYEALAVAWAIDALEPADQVAFEAHRDGCGLCAAAVLTAMQVATELAYGVPDVEPPAFLRQRVLAAATPRPPAPGVSPEGSSGHGAARDDGHRRDRSRGDSGHRTGTDPGDPAGVHPDARGREGDRPAAAGDGSDEGGDSQDHITVGDQRVGRDDAPSRSLGQPAETQDGKRDDTGSRDLGQPARTRDSERADDIEHRNLGQPSGARDHGRNDARSLGQPTGTRDGEQDDARSGDLGQPARTEDNERNDARSPERGQPAGMGVGGRRGGARGAHRADASRRAGGRRGGGPRSWGQRPVEMAGAGVGVRDAAGVGPTGRGADRGRAVRGRRRALSVLAAAALVGLSAVTTWQVTRPVPAVAPALAADRVAALSTQSGDRTLATVVVRGDSADVVTDGLAPNAGRNTRYVLWGVPASRAGTPRVVGTFEVTAEGLQSYPVQLTQSLDAYPVLAVSEERAGSTPSEPSRVLARGALGR